GLRRRHVLLQERIVLGGLLSDTEAATAAEAACATQARLWISHHVASYGQWRLAEGKRLVWRCRAGRRGRLLGQPEVERRSNVRGAHSRGVDRQRVERNIIQETAARSGGRFSVFEIGA